MRKAPESLVLEDPIAADRVRSNRYDPMRFEEEEDQLTNTRKAMQVQNASIQDKRNKSRSNTRENTQNEKVQKE